MCGSAFWTAFSAFPSEADGPRPAVMFSSAFGGGVSVHEEVPMLTLRLFSDVGVAVIPSVADRPVRRIINRLVGRDNRMDEVSVLSSVELGMRPCHIVNGFACCIPWV